jgi:hypothetical protein
LSSIVLTESMNKALNLISSLLKELQGEWLIGGSCGLLLQNIQLSAQPRDLDIYTDDEFIKEMADILQPYAIDQPHYSETSIYRSNLSHYHLEGVKVELVGSFRINSEGSSYNVEVSDVMKRFSLVRTLSGEALNIMPLAHEFVFNILRKRPDRYESIAQKMQLQPDLYVSALKEIIKRNQFSPEHLEQMSKLLRISL